MARANLTEFAPGNEATSMDVLQFAILKADAIESFNENPFGSGRRAWHSLINSVLAELPREVIKETSLPHRIYGYEVERSGADQIIDIIHEFDKFTAPENRRYHDDGRITEHGILSSFTQEARFLDALQHDPSSLSTRGLARIRSLQKVHSQVGAVEASEKIAISQPLKQNQKLYRLRHVKEAFQLSSYGSNYLQFIEDTYHL